MKLNEFVQSVLEDIENGLQNAYKVTGKNYSIHSTDNNGVSFDIAVTTSSSSSGEATGKAKVGFIEVLGADVGGKVEGKIENSEISRIKFIVHFPKKTQREIEQHEAEALRQLEENKPDWA